jgi:hypothetical protein
MIMIRVVCLLCVLSIGVCLGNDVHSYHPKDGYVPEQATAMAIAEAVLVAIYGKEQIQRQKPFKIELKDNIWTIEGRAPSGSGALYLGGTALVRISRATGEILQVTHSK